MGAVGGRTISPSFPLGFPSFLDFLLVAAMRSSLLAFALLGAANAWQPNAANDWQFIPGGLKAHVSCIIEVPAGGASASTE
jgi:hypothetical protein